tara:strand:- start:55 stop:690 length:636 start_codon:yes stop_codon:yes gene_type:complete
MMGRFGYGNFFERYLFDAMKKIFLLSILLIISGCKGKQADDNFPEFEFRSNLKLLGDFENFGPFSLRLPKNYNQIDLERFTQLKDALKNERNSFFNIELIKAFSAQENSVILISKIDESNVFLKLDDAYFEYLSSMPETVSVSKSSFKLNGINTVQYQINGKTLTNIKLLFPILDKTYYLNYYVSNLLFNDKLSEFESCLSTLEIDKEFIE